MPAHPGSLPAGQELDGYLAQGWSVDESGDDDDSSRIIIIAPSGSCFAASAMRAGHEYSSELSLEVFRAEEQVARRILELQDSIRAKTGDFHGLRRWTPAQIEAARLL